jgi:hypothetical protein
VLVAGAAASAAGCGSPASSPAAAANEQPAVAWNTLGSWTGRGSTQTESFLVEGSVVRIRWETRTQAANGDGTFRLTYHSAVSGRELGVAADQRGAGRGEAYIPEEPRPAYFIVESEHLHWSFSVDEGVAGTVAATATTGAKPK